MSIRSFEGHTPQLDAQAWVDDTALVLGDVILGEESSVWPMAAVRGDIHHIHIGKRSNIQDGTIIHVTHASRFNSEGFPTLIGDEVTIGHQAVIHACRIDTLSLIGMGAVLLDGCHVQSQVMVGAGSLVPPGKILESGYLWLGSPVRRIRRLTKQEHDYLSYSAHYYVELKNRHCVTAG